MEAAADSADTATLQTLKTLDSLETKIQNVKTAWQSFYANLGLEDVFKGFLEVLTIVLNNLNSMPKLFGKIPVAAIGVAAQIINVIKSMGSMILVQMAETWTRVSEIIRQSIKEGCEKGSQQGQASIQAHMSAIGGKAGLAGTALTAAGAGLALGANLIGNNNAFGRGAMRATAGLSSFAGSIFTGAAAGGVPGAVIGGVTGLISAIPNLVGAWQDFTKAELYAAEAAKKHAKELANEALQAKSEAKNLSSTIDKLKELEDARYDSNEAYKEWLDYKDQIADSYPELVSMYTGEGEAVINLADAYGLLAQKRTEAAKKSLEEREAELEATIKTNKMAQNALNKANNIDFASSSLGPRGDAWGKGLPNVGRMYTADNGEVSLSLGSYGDAILSKDTANKVFSDSYKGTLNFSTEAIKAARAEGINNKIALSQLYYEAFESSGIFDNLDFAEITGFTKEKIEQLADDYKDDLDGLAEQYLRIIGIYIANAEAYGENQEKLAKVQQELGKAEYQYAEDLNARIEHNEGNTAKQALLSKMQGDQFLMGLYAQTYDPNKDNSEQIIDSLIGAREDIDDEKYKQLVSITSNTQNYTSVEEALSAIYAIVPEEIANGFLGLKPYIQETFESKNIEMQKQFRESLENSIDDNIINPFSTLLASIGDNNSDNGEIAARYLGAIQKQWGELVNKNYREGNTIEATSNAKLLSGAYSFAGRLVEEEAKDAITSILTTATWDTRDGLEALSTSLQSYIDGLDSTADAESIKNIKGIIDLINSRKGALYVNINTELNTFADSLDDIVTKANTVIKAQTSGLDDFGDIQDALNEINSARGASNQLSFNEVFTSNEAGKLVYTIQGFNAAMGATIGKARTTYNQVITDIEEQVNYLDNFNNKAGGAKEALEQRRAELNLETDAKEIAFIDAQIKIIGDSGEKISDWLLRMKEEYASQTKEASSTFDAAVNLIATTFRKSAAEAIDYTAILNNTTTFAKARNNLINYIQARLLEDNNYLRQMAMLYGYDGASIDTDIEKNRESVANFVGKHVEDIAKSMYADLANPNKAWDTARSMNPEATYDQLVEARSSSYSTAQELLSKMIDAINSGSKFILSEAEAKILGYTDEDLANGEIYFDSAAENLSDSLDLMWSIISQGVQYGAISVGEQNELLEKQNTDGRKRQEAVYSLIASGRNLKLEDFSTLAGIFNTSSVDFIEALKNAGALTQEGDIYSIGEGQLSNFIATLNELFGFVVEQTGEAWTEAYGSYVDGRKSFKEYLSLSSKVGEGFESSDAIRSIIQDLDESDYIFNDILNKYSLTASGIRKAMKQQEEKMRAEGYSEEDIANARKMFSRTFAQQVDISGFLSSERTSLDAAQLKYEYENYVATLEEGTYDVWEAFFGKINAGGGAAIKEANKLAAAAGTKLTSEQLTDLYYGNVIAPYANALDNLDVQVGQIVNKDVAQLLQNVNEYVLEPIDEEGNALVTAIGKVGEAYLSIYRQMVAEGIEDEALLKEYRTKAIEEHNKERTRLSDSLSGLTELQPGDWFDITEIGEIPQQLAAQLENLGASIQNGILQFGEGANMLGIFTKLRDGLELNEETKAKFSDAINTILGDTVSSISKGIGGTLTQTEAYGLTEFGKLHDIQDMEFSKTEEGLKLSQKSAIALYNVIKQIDGMQSKVVFKELSDSLKETHQSYKDIPSILARIATLQKEIANMPVGSARRKEYEQELALAKEIKETRSLTDEDAFNFMSNELPTPFKAQLGYWDSIGQAYKAMNEAGESGFMGVQDFYNIVNYMNSMAKDMGHNLEFMGMTLDGSLESASALIQKGFSALANVDGEGAKVSMERLGTNTLSGAKDMQKGIKGTVKEMAKSQIELLDAMIAFLEVIVAFEKFKEIDTDGEFGLSFKEMFVKTNEKDEKTGEDLYIANKQTKKLAKDLLDLAKNNKDLANGLDNVRINGVSVREALEKLSDGTKLTQEKWENYRKAADIMYRAAASNDYSTENITNLIREAFKNENEVNEVEIYGRKFLVKGDIVIEADEDGYYIVDGVRTKDPEKALRAQDLKQTEDALNVHSSHDSKGNRYVTGDIQIDTTHKVKVRTNIETGEKEWKLPGGQWTNDKDKVMKDALDDGLKDYLRQHGINPDNPKDEKAALQETINYYKDYNIVGKFNFTLSEIESNLGTTINNLSDEQLKALLGDKFDAALVANIEIAINRALRDINLGELILDGLLGKESEGNIYAVNYEELKANPKLVDLGRQLGIGIILAVQQGIEEANTGGTGADGEETGNAVADSIANGLEGGKEQVETASGHVADSATSPFKALIDPNNNDSFKSWGMTAIQQFVEGFNIIDSEGNSNFASIFGKQFIDPIKQVLVDNNDNFKSWGMTAAQSFADGFSITDSEGKSNFGEVLGEQITSPIKTALQALFTKETLDQLVKDFETNSTIALSFDSIDVGKLTEASDAVAGAIDTATTAINKLSTSLSKIPDKSSEVNNTASALNNLHSRSIQVKANMHVDVSGASTSWWDSGWQTLAKGNTDLTGIALAGGRKTLMGELGPELVVSGGRYYVVGQNGAEMVNLADDAIVFNHMQTKRLMENGKSGRGTPVVSERAAVSMATGNFSGPAMATASEVLALLKQLRAMWQGMLNASTKDLGIMAGISADKEQEAAAENGTLGSTWSRRTSIGDFQRWYNLLRQIDKIEQDITYQQSLRNKLESDRIANGRAVYQTYKQELSLLEDEIKANRELSNLQKSKYDNMRAALEKSEYGKIYTYTEDGLQQLAGSGEPGSGLGLDILEHLTQREINGQYVGAAEDVKSQLDYLRSIGFNTENLKYSKDGTVIDVSTAQSDEELYNMYVQMMENFWANVDELKDTLDGYHDSYINALNTAIEKETQRNKLLQEVIDNQIAVEDRILSAIETREQRAIDEAQKTRDTIEENSNKFIDGLSDQLQKERDMYAKQDSQNELTRLQRQLAVLQRSGGSSSQIRSLQDQITIKQRDNYLEAQQEQIDAIQEASNKELERLDRQIDIMTETLAYQKENGLFWEEIYDVMSKSEEEILNFIRDGEGGWLDKSITGVGEEILKLQRQIQFWLGYRDDENGIDTSGSSSYASSQDWQDFVSSISGRYKIVDSSLGNMVSQLANAMYDSALQRTGDTNQAESAARKYIEQWEKKYNERFTRQSGNITYSEIPAPDAWAPFLESSGIKELANQALVNDELKKNWNDLLTYFKEAGDWFNDSGLERIPDEQYFNLEDFTVSVNVGSISSDYEASRAGEKLGAAFTKAVKKSNTRSVSRR